MKFCRSLYSWVPCACTPLTVYLKPFHEVRKLGYFAGSLISEEISMSLRQHWGSAVRERGCTASSPSERTSMKDQTFSNEQSKSDSCLALFDASPWSFSALFFPCVFCFVPGFWISWDMNICVHDDVKIKGMEEASLSGSTADNGAVVALADFKSVNYLGKNI